MASVIQYYEGIGSVVVIGNYLPRQCGIATFTTHVKALEALIEKKEDICICGIILTEVLQGIKEESEFKKTKDIITSL